MITTEKLYALSIAALLLPATVSADIPSELAQLDKLSSTIEMAVEKAPLVATNKLRPQLVQIAMPIDFKAVITDQQRLKNLALANYQVADNKKILIERPQASFIQVHFSQLNIPNGSYIEVKNREGTQVHRYGNDTPSLFTLREGDDGISSFSALTIFGDTAIIELVSANSNDTLLTTDNQQLNQPYHIEIDSIMQGMTDAEIEQTNNDQNLSIKQFDIEPQSTCGVTERPDAQCWADTRPIEFERSRPVARLLINGSSSCTAWRVGEDNRMFTNNHCISSATGPGKTEVWFNYQKSGCGSGSTSGTVIVTGDQLLSTNSDLDYTLFTLKNFAQITQFGHYGLDVRNPIDQERIYIPQHGHGQPKQLAIESDKNSDGLCRVDVTLADGSAPNTDMGYMCDTIGGSSGSPVLAASTNNVLALHHFGGCPNQGVLINLIWPQVTEHFANQIPIGDNGEPSDLPLASFNYVSNVLQVSFNDTSSDNDGTVVDHQWDFGDGETSNLQNPVHLYSVAGDYSVTLTVLDNDGNSNTNTQVVSVTNDNNGELIKGVALTDLSAQTGQNLEFYFDAPAEASSVSFKLVGGSGDADLYVKFAEPPSKNDYDCRPYKSGNNEACNFSGAQQGRYYVLLDAYRTFSGAELTADYTESASGVSFEQAELTGTSGNWQHYSLNIPENMNQLIGKISGGSGDADLYVRFGDQPTSSSYNCRPYKSGNDETCSITNPQAGVWYFSVRAYSNYSGVTLRGEAN